MKRNIKKQFWVKVIDPQYFMVNVALWRKRDEYDSGFELKTIEWKINLN